MLAQPRGGVWQTSPAIREHKHLVPLAHIIRSAAWEEISLQDKHIEFEPLNYGRDPDDRVICNVDGSSSPVNTKHLYNMCTMLDVVQKNK